MDNKPKISVIIPVYNVEEYLEQCIESVINQTFRDIEIICVNDGSTDGSLKILEKYKNNDERIKILDQENEGLSSARNRGLQIAQGDYICFLDSDDWISLVMLQDCYKLIKENDIDILAFDINNIYNASIVPVHRVGYFLNKYKANIVNFKQYPEVAYLNCSAWSKLYKRDFLISNNLYFSEDIKVSEDVPYWFSLLFLNPKIMLTDKCYYYYRKREGSLSKQDKEVLYKVLDSYYKFKNFNNYKLTSEFNRLITLDYWCRLLVYHYSAFNDFHLLPIFEQQLKSIKAEYQNFHQYNLWQLKGYRLLKFRWIYTIGKKVVLHILKQRGKYAK